MTAVIERVLDVELEKKLVAFDETVKAHECLEIDGDFMKDGECFIKVLRHPYPKNTQPNSNGRGTAYSVPLTTIKESPTSALVSALETGVVEPLYGVTRIVGYYSRISNWNKSKLGELKDRHRGNYSVEGLRRAG